MRVDPLQQVARVAMLLLALVVTACTDPASESEIEKGEKAEAPAALRRSSVLLITVDTLRADRLGAYGYPLATSPKIDALAAQGVRYANATVQWPKTWPSLASFLTGSYPHTTGIGAIPRVLPDSLLLMGEIFEQAGYETAAVVSNFNAGRSLGFDQGFAHFDQSWEKMWKREAGAEQEFVNSPGKVKKYTNATLVTDQALRWLWARADSERPFFLWVHYMDPHGPYVPPPEYGELFTGQHPSSEIPLRLLPAYQQQRVAGHLVTDLAFYQAQYDREVRYLDAEVGRLLETVGWSAPESMLTVLTADHGESLGEHGYYLEHGALSYQPTAAVPLIVVQPGVIEPGRVIERPVGLIDVSATIVELAGLLVPASFEGRSLASELRGEPPGSPPEYVFTQSGSVPIAPQLSVRHGRWKLIQVRSPAERALMTGAEYELYDLQADPAELVNVADREPEIVARLSQALDEWYVERPGTSPLGDALDVDSLDESSRKLLEALGYLEPTDDGDE